MQDYTALEKKLGYEFRDKKLLKHALIHSSYAAEHGMEYEENNERLEFIGDAYLDAVIGKKLYESMPHEPEGVLSKTRANIVCEGSLARVARQISLGDFLMLGHGEELHGGRDKDSILSDAMEAVIGAIIIEAGYDICDHVVLKLFRENVVLALQGKLYHDYKSALQERLQGMQKKGHVDYVLVSEDGPDHDKTFTVEVRSDGRVLGTGTGKNKKTAEQEAARNVLMKGVQ